VLAQPFGARLENRTVQPMFERWPSGRLTEPVSC
jgi:hypothetical protein